MRPLTRYVLLQLPGWLVAGGLVYWCWPATGLSPLLGVGVLAAWIAKDFVVYPLLRVGYESGKTGVEHLLGMEAVVSRALDPVGYVRVRGERWRAELASDERSDAAPAAAPIPAGAIVEIRSASGLTLYVARRR